MKPKRIELADDDQKARDRIRENLEICAWDRTLSRKVLIRFSTAAGPMTAMIPEWVDIDSLKTYSQSSVAPPGTPTYYGPGEAPMNLLVDFVVEYLQSAADALVVCENTGVARQSLKIWTWSRPPRVSSYGNEEVYYILEPSDLDREMIDAALSDALGQWATVVCSQTKQIPDGDMTDDSFLNEVVENAKHILMPAFDNDGFLIWTPMVRAD